MKRLISMAAVALITTVGSTARADSAKFDDAMKPVLAEYLKIQKALAADSEKGVSAQAKRIEQLAGTLDTTAATGEHAEHYQTLPAELKAAAVALGSAKGIDARREAFKGVSKAMTMWANRSRPAGVYVAFCSMAKASWLQADKTIANPYYGSKMLTCGELTSGPEAKPMAMDEGEHDHDHDHDLENIDISKFKKSPKTRKATNKGHAH